MICVILDNNLFQVVRWWMPGCDRYRVVLCQCHTRDACRLHAGCIQAACSLHAACYILHAGCCNLHCPATSCICRRRPPAYAGCMKPAWSLHAGCNLLHAACCNLQPPAYDRIHKERDNRHSFWSILTCRASTPTCRASTPALWRRRPSNQSEFYDVASFILCTFDFLVTFTTVEQLFTSVNSPEHK